MIFICTTVTDALIKRAKAKWDTSNNMEELQCDIDAYIASLREAGLSELTEEYKV